MRSVVCTAIALVCENLRAQTPPGGPQFEVASVKPAANEEMSGGRVLSAREMRREVRPPGVVPMDDPGRDWRIGR